MAYIPGRNSKVSSTANRTLQHTERLESYTHAYHPPRQQIQHNSGAFSLGSKISQARGSLHYIFRSKFCLRPSSSQDEPRLHRAPRAARCIDAATDAVSSAEDAVAAHPDLLISGGTTTTADAAVVYRAYSRAVATHHRSTYGGKIFMQESPRREKWGAVLVKNT